MLGSYTYRILIRGLAFTTHDAIFWALSDIHIHINTFALSLSVWQGELRLRSASGNWLQPTLTSPSRTWPIAACLSTISTNFINLHGGSTTCSSTLLYCTELKDRNYVVSTFRDVCLVHLISPIYYSFTVYSQFSFFFLIMWNLLLYCLSRASKKCLSSCHLFDAKATGSGTLISCPQHKQ